eukprot:TRINITY_DN7177_c0_g1_i7.p2 TRINITY_DN7177_c0_g1~~TRINITY_DN7177_c0_g1_i7.p2  ORF type:complete len:100 (+),score=14.55 TRINITY_DN7177_c0_g1_i7:68-367(+)
MGVAMEAGYLNYIRDLEYLEAGGEIEKGTFYHRMDEYQVLDYHLDEVLKRFPSFNGNFQACDARRKATLRQWWTQKDSRLIPLLRACADLGNFDEALHP